MCWRKALAAMRSVDNWRPCVPCPLLFLIDQATCTFLHSYYWVVALQFQWDKHSYNMFSYVNVIAISLDWAVYILSSILEYPFEDKIIDSTIDSTISRYSGQSYIMCFSANRKIAARYHLPFYLGWCFHNRKVWKQRAQWNRQSSAVCALKYMLLLQTYSIRSSISTSTPQVSDNLTHQPMPLTTHTCHLDPLQISNLNSQGVLSVFKCNNRLGLCAPYWMLNACESP